MTIGIAIPFWLRGKYNEAYAISFAYYSKIAKRHGIRVHLCGSEGRISEQFCEPFLNEFVCYHEVPQQEFCIGSSGDDYLRAKFNHSLATLIPHDPDLYCLVGADDIVCPEFWEFCKRHTQHWTLMFGISSTSELIVHDLTRNNHYDVALSYRTSYSLLPGVNAFTRSAMNLCGCVPYKLAGCETGAEKYMAMLNVGTVTFKGWVYMVKTDDVLNPMRKILKRHLHTEASPEMIQRIQNALNA
jgi:hypothetical protein